MELWQILIYSTKVWIILCTFVNYLGSLSKKANRHYECEQLLVWLFCSPPTENCVRLLRTFIWKKYFLSIILLLWWGNDEYSELFLSRFYQKYAKLCSTTHGDRIPLNISGWRKSKIPFMKFGNSPKKVRNIFYTIFQPGYREIYW